MLKSKCTQPRGLFLLCVSAQLSENNFAQSVKVFAEHGLSRGNLDDVAPTHPQHAAADSGIVFRAAGISPDKDTDCQYSKKIGVAAFYPKRAGRVFSADVDNTICADGYCGRGGDNQSHRLKCLVCPCAVFDPALLDRLLNMPMPKR